MYAQGFYTKPKLYLNVFIIYYDAGVWRKHLLYIYKAFLVFTLKPQHSVIVVSALASHVNKQYIFFNVLFF